MTAAPTVIEKIPGFPYRSYPMGWFQIGWTMEFTASTASARTFFGQELAVYRGESGDLHVTDGYCPHMGAHLGYSRVEGDCLRCPFHAWLWDANGKVVEIPYSERLNASRTLRNWHVREKHGVVFVWHHPFDEPPVWAEPIPDVPGAETDALYPVYPHACHVEELQMQPQFGAENIADPGHNAGVHRWIGKPRVERFSEDGHVFVTETKGQVPSKTGLVTQTIKAAAHGLGVLFSQHDLDLGDPENLAHECASVCVTPTRGLNSKLFTTSWIPKTAGDTGDVPTGAAAAMVRGTHREIFQADAAIWNNMRYEPDPPYALEEAKVMKALRAWCEQYYPAG